MKRTISLLLGVLAFALLPSVAQQQPPTIPMGKVHGHVTNPTGAPQTAGAISFVETTRAASGPGLSAQTADKGTFQVDPNGDYKGEVPSGSFTVIYRSEERRVGKEC